ncbi:GAF domain-containing protein [Candidatus Gracilibacteria bacterium]|nr:GAF domain-containing protein [Candidatus Gracilibacteria bacterium]
MTAQFDRLARVVARSVQAPIALITLVHSDYTYLVGMSGVTEPWASTRRAPLTASLCQNVVALDAPVLITEITSDQTTAIYAPGPELGLMAYAGVPLRGADGAVIGTVCAIDQVPHSWGDDVLDILADIAEVVMSEFERGTARDVAATGVDEIDYEQAFEASQRLASLGVLAGGAAHDFNNLLVAVLGNAELALLGVSESSPAAENITSIIAAARSAAALAQQMLVYAGRRKARVEPVDVNQLITDMSQLLMAAVPRSITVVQQLGVVPVQFRASDVQLRQVVMNLILNAAEAIGTRSGEITLRTDVRILNDGEWLMPQSGRALPPGCYVVIEVSDTGCGMPPELQARIFEPFVTTKARGHGLGLAVVLGIVRQHDGGVSVQSSVGGGTSFAVAFPCA